jgi:hypothetical protein
LFNTFSVHVAGASRVPGIERAARRSSLGLVNGEGKTVIFVLQETTKPIMKQEEETPPKIDSKGLEVRLEAKGPFKAGGSIMIMMTVSNPTTAPRTFCAYHAPFEGIQKDIFKVSSSMKDIEYKGMMMKRGPPKRQHFITLAPGESSTTTVDLSEGYDIPPGEYAVSYRKTGISGLPKAGPVSISVTD